MGKVVRLPLEDLVDGDAVEETVNTGENQGNHLVDSHGLVLLLLEELGKTFTTAKSLLGGSIQIGTELGESSNLTVLGQEKLQGTSDLLHGLELSGGTDTGDGQTDVNGGTDTLVEEFGFQENLAIGNGDDVGWNVGRHVTTLGFNDWESGERAALVLVVELGRAFKETRVEVENTVNEVRGLSWIPIWQEIKDSLSGVGLTTWGTSEKERHLTVGNGLLGKIVVDDNSVSATVSEPLANRSR